MDGQTRAAVDWLLSSAEPAVRMLTRRDLLGADTVGTDDVLDGPIVRALLSGNGRTEGSVCTLTANGEGRTGDSCR